MPENIRDSGQPHRVYTYALQPHVLIQEKLGIIEGLRDFSHPFKFVENVYDLIKTLESYRKQDLLKDEWKKTEIKATFDKQALLEFHQIWSGETYIKIELNEYGETKKESIALKQFPQVENVEYYPITSLKNLIPMEDTELNNLLIRIGSDIPEKYAYEGTDIISLDTIGGCYDLMPKNYQCSVCGRVGHQAWYTSQDDLDASNQLSDGWVTKSYYKKLKDMLFSALDDRWYILKTNIVSMAKELSGNSYEDRDSDSSEDVKDE